MIEQLKQWWVWYRAWRAGTLCDARHVRTIGLQGEVLLCGRAQHHPGSHAHSITWEDTPQLQSVLRP